MISRRSMKFLGNNSSNLRGGRRIATVALASITIQFASLSSYRCLLATTTTTTTAAASLSYLKVAKPLFRGGGGGGATFINCFGRKRTSSLSHLAALNTSIRNNNNKRMDQSSFTTWSYDNPCTTMEWTEMSSSVSLLVSTSAMNNMDDDDDDADLIVVGVFAPAKIQQQETEDDDDNDNDEIEPPTIVSLEGKAKKLDDEKLNGILSTTILENAKEFHHGSKAGSVTPTQRIFSIMNNGGKKKSKRNKRYVVMGLGTVPTEESTTPLEREGGGTLGFAIGEALAKLGHDEKKVQHIKMFLPESSVITRSIADDDDNDDDTISILLKDISSSFYTSLYSDNRFRNGKQIKIVAEDLKTVTLVLLDYGGGDGKSISSSSSSSVAVFNSKVAAAALEEGKKIVTGIYLTKDIVNAPHNVLNSISLANTARRIVAKESVYDGRLECTILGSKECEELYGMGAYLGVARGSETEPQFIHIKYSPPPNSGDGIVIINKRVGIVGKGLLFDTGGYNIKTQMMELMKKDCAAAAAVLGAARAVAALQPEGVEAHFVVAACENMINEKAMVASDILTASNGKTIEVMNTDAEGRLTLADALVYCDKQLNCDSIIDLATLTGACQVALGRKMSGFWTDDDDLAKELEDIAKLTGEKTWRMPLEKSYNEQLESKIADISNLGGPYGGAITAALFLQNFVSKKKQYAHFDCSGPVWDFNNGGATGYGTKLVTEWVRRQGIEK